MKCRAGRENMNIAQKRRKRLLKTQGCTAMLSQVFPACHSIYFHEEMGAQVAGGLAARRIQSVAQRLLNYELRETVILCWFCGTLALPASSASRALKPVSEDLTGFDMFFPCCGFAEDFVRTTAVPLYQHCYFLNQRPSMCFIVGFVVTKCCKNFVDHLQHSNKLDCIHHPILGRTTEWKGHTVSYKCALF